MSVDSRVVDLKFNYSSFADGVKNVLGGLANLKKGLQLDGATKGIDKVNSAAKGANMAPMVDGVNEVTRGFSVMQIAGVAALATVVTKAVSAGAQFAKSFSFAPIMDGFGEYELKMKSIQTILANTARHGTSLDTVNSELDALNKYADKTIYNFAEMTKNASLFTNSGMKIEDATQVIKGFSNAAAASGTGASEAAGAAFQLSQAFATGTIRLMDWRSLTNRGMGNKNMQDSLVELAGAMGTISEASTSAEKIQQDFNGSLQDGWLSADVMTTYLKIMAGNYDAAQLSAMGLTDASVKGLLEQAKTAEESATKVRSFTQLIGTMKEAVASGWTDTFEILIGDFTEATDLFTAISDKVGGFLGDAADSRNNLLTEWKDMGGRTELLSGLENIFKAILAVITPIKDAFREIFPAQTAENLYEMTVNFRKFTEDLIIGEGTAKQVQSTFQGLFAIFSIAAQVIGAAGNKILEVIGSITGKDMGFLDLSAGVGEFLTSIDTVLKNGTHLEDFFDNLGQILGVPLKALETVGRALGNLFEGFDPSDAEAVTAWLDGVSTRFDPLKKLGQELREIWDSIGETVRNVAGKVGTALGAVGDWIADAFASTNFDKTLDIINTGLLGGILIMIKKFLKGGDVNISFGEGLFSSIKGTFNAATESMKNMQTQIKADTLMKIAGALAVLTASIFVLSTIDSGKLTSALVGLSVGFLGLQVSLIAMSKGISYLGMAKLPLLTIALGALAFAMLGFALALKLMSTIPADQMTTALIGMAGSLAIVSAAMHSMPKNMVGQAAGLLILGVALNAIALALKSFADMSLDEAVQGMIGMAGSLLILSAAMHAMPNNMLVKAAAMLVLAVAMNALGAAVKIFASMNLDQIITGLAGVAGVLLVVSAAMHSMPKGMLLQAVALTVVAAAINVLALAVKQMAGLSMEEMATGLGTLGGSLVILAMGLHLMNGALGGAIALTVAAGALMLLTPVLITLGSLDIATIVTGLGAMAGVFLVFAVAGYALAPVVPVILGLAAAMVLIGAGMALAGVGVAAFASAFAIAVVLGAAGIKVLAGLLMTFISSIPAIIAAFARGIVEFAKIIASSGAAFFKAIFTILKSMLDAVIATIPKLGQLFMTLINTALAILVNAVPRMVAAGAQILLGVLKGIANNIGGITTQAINVIVNFIDAISAGLPKIIQSGVTLVISFINGVADAIRNNTAPLVAAGVNLATAIVEGMVKGLAQGVKSVVSAAGRMAQSALDSAMGVLGIKSPSKEFEKIGKFVVEGFTKGMNGDRNQVQEAFNSMDEMLRDTMKSAQENVGQLTERLAELNAEEKKNEKQIAKTSAALAQANADLKLAQLGHRRLTYGLGDETNALKKLALQYTDYQEQIKSADDQLKDSIRIRDQYMKSIWNQYADLPDITGETTLAKYMEELTGKIGETREFVLAMSKLRELGLSGGLYQELLSKGPDALPFVAELVSGGKGAVSAFNELNNELSDIAEQFGEHASTEMYQAGVDSAQGLVDGLKSKASELKKTMQELGGFIVDEMKKELGIKSPSRRFMELGAYSIEGLAKGLRQTSAVTSAVENIGDEAVSTLRKSLMDFGAAMSGDIDLNPTITPVLDLTKLKKDASGIGALMGGHSLNLDSAYLKAKTISKGYNDNRAVYADDMAPVEQVQNVKFEQNNYSPKALSSAQLYRQTKNQLSRAKGALSTS